MEELENPNPQAEGASTDPVLIWPHHLARACRRSAGASTRTEAFVATLEGLRSATGAERAFLLESAPPPRWAHALAVSPERRLGRGSFSRSIAARALTGDRALFLPDLGTIADGPDGPSVGSLSLRAALGIPVPNRTGPRATIILDTRDRITIDARQWDMVGGAFASLIALVRGMEPAVFERNTTSRISVAQQRPPGSAAMRHLHEEVRRAARVPLPVLVTGPPGAGKELVARALHARGPRSGRPFVAINCATIPDALLERELFGALRGAYTGADRDHPGLFRQAEGGTVFLDEIGDMPQPLQAKLLRVVQEGAVRPVGGFEELPVDVRIVAATHRDLGALVEGGSFRADLRDRLAILLLRVPALSERAEDLPDLAREILDRLASRCCLPVPLLTEGAVARLQAQAWPGNVRELEAVLARTLLRADGGVVDVDDLVLGPRSHDATSGAAPDIELERAMIGGALAASGGSLTRAALRIGWSRQKLHRRMAALGIRSARRQASSGG